MPLRIEETEDGVWIEVEAEGDIAVSVTSGEEESIYLPSDGSDTTYYVEHGVESTDSGFRFFHPAEIDSVELLTLE